jgi:hypothetical protein
MITRYYRYRLPVNERNRNFRRPTPNWMETKKNLGFPREIITVRVFEVWSRWAYNRIGVRQAC